MEIFEQIIQNNALKVLWITGTPTQHLNKNWESNEWTRIEVQQRNENIKTRDPTTEK